MKKIVSVLLVALTLCMCLTSCSKSEAAKEVEQKIKAIGEVTIDKGEAIEEAEKAYAFLTGEDKGDVKNYDDLVSAKEAYNKLKEVSDLCDALKDKIDSAFTQYGISYTEIKDKYEEIFELIPDEEEGKDGKYSFAEELRAKYDEFTSASANAEKSAVSYIKGLMEINKDKEITVENIGCIMQISDATEYYLFAVEYKEDGESKVKYSSARFAGTPSVQSMLSYAENFYGDAPASEKTDALKNGNVVLDVAKVIEEIAK